MEWVSKVRYKIIITLPLLAMLTISSKALAETYTLKVHKLGCSTIEDWKEMLGYLKEKDRRTAHQMVGIGKPCLALEAGTKFDIYERNKKIEGYPKKFMLVRPYGTRSKLWIIDNHWDFDMEGGNK